MDAPSDAHIIKKIGKYIRNLKSYEHNTDTSDLESLLDILRSVSEVRKHGNWLVK